MVKVRVTGPPKSGKSAIAQLIAEGLDRLGFRVVLDDNDLPRTKEDLQDVLVALSAQRSKVKVRAD